MNKLLKGMLALILVTSIITNTSAINQEVNGEELAEAVAENYIAKRSNVANEWNGKIIISSEALFDEKSVINGYVFSLSDGGYVITKKSVDNEYLVMQASYEAPSPYINASGENVYLGLFNYYEKTGIAEFNDLLRDEIVNSEDLVDTFDASAVAEVLNFQSSTYSTTAADVFVGSLTSIEQIPTLNQGIVSLHHCAPTAAADIVRYAQLYEGMNWNADKVAYASYTGYSAFITEMGEYMKTGTVFAGTVDSDVAKGLQNFLADNTDFTAYVRMFGGSSGVNMPTFETFMTYIDASYPVLVTLPNAAFKKINNPDVTEINTDFHSVAAFGYTDDNKMIVADPNGGYRVEISYLHKSYSIYALDRVSFNY